MTQVEGRDVMEATAIATMPRSMPSDALAVQTNELLQDAANEAARNITGALVAVDKAGEQVARLPLKCRPQKEVLEQLTAVDEMEGTTRSDRAQDQRHREAMFRWSIMAAQQQQEAAAQLHARTMEAFHAMADIAMQNMQDAEDARAAKRAYEELVQQQDAEDGEDSQAAQLAANVLSVAMSRLLAPSNGAKPAAKATAADDSSSDGE